MILEKNERREVMDIDQNIVDDDGTGQEEASDMLRAFCERGFAGDTDQAAVALGRDPGDVREMAAGGAEIDDDLVMKMRGIARERGIDL
jgi:hypothetical protein